MYGVELLKIVVIHGVWKSLDTRESGIWNLRFIYK